MSSSTANDSASTDLFNDTIPESYEGWEQVQSEDAIFEFWRRGSNHITAEYERLRAFERSDEDIQLSKTKYNQFGHVVNSELLTRRGHDRADWIWSRAQSAMERWPAVEPFDGKPGIPEDVRNWSLDYDGMSEEWLNGENSLQSSIRTTKWDCDDAELAVVETGIENHYAATYRHHTISYQDNSGEQTPIAEDIPRRMAFEIAVHTMQALPAPLNELGDWQKNLKEIDGIGPAKSKSLLLLGVTSRQDLKTLLEDETAVNYKHRDAIKKLMSQRVYGSLNIDPDGV